MRGLLRWILVIILFAVVVFLFINLFNRGKNAASNNNNGNDNAPITYEESDRPVIDDSEDISNEPIYEEQSVEVGDTANFGTIGAFLGVFTIAGAILFVRKKSADF